MVESKKKVERKIEKIINYLRHMVGMKEKNVLWWWQQQKESHVKEHFLVAFYAFNSHSGLFCYFFLLVPL